ncbi:FMN-binding negative transcriptional regulator [Niveispirillum irakense]|uniref:FMN-binding negative transcriptional regulator n=1 Tax=Niveispirillum irakense TaxID=34011 RepID=UPI00040173E1|nr:FMN-binding negative transcriptional regulator [Niveispirillum irakense]
MSDLFRPREDAQIADLIRQYPLAWVTARGATPAAASPLPLLADVDGQGRVVTLLGHMARTNPLVAALEADPRALILFQGPQSYISPNWAGERTWGPTWNYAVITIEAEIQLRPDLNDHALERLVNAVEQNHHQPWKVAEMGPRYEKLVQYIVAFEAKVTRLDARFKLGQDERPEIFANILDALGPDDELAGWMRRNRDI